MDRSDVTELHYITPIENVPSILNRGILSNARAARIQHGSVAMEEVQDRRRTRVVPGGRPLHAHANLYFSARNPMLYKRLSMHQHLCVLRVSAEVLDLPGVVIADGNASSDYTAFYASPAGLARLDRADVYAEFWTDDDPIRAWERKRRCCAEVLVPDRVSADRIQGTYVSCDEAREALASLRPKLPIEVNPHLFFRG